jgi:rod shape-determining protein MreD
MINKARFILTLAAALFLQVSCIPAFLAAPFQPNLTIFFVIHLGLREPFRYTNCLACFVIGLVQDAYSGTYFGLQGLIYLFVYLLLGQTSGRLYTDNNLLILLGVFLGIMFNGLLTLGLLLLFSSAEGMYAALFAGLIPHALMSTLAAAVLVRVIPGPAAGRAR